ncbi:MAG: hypothetical protein KDA96_09465 [Planctomycetaceae bacterium]|nr:hypothetical protein [Planctomycetaceae bacterium]
MLICVFAVRQASASQLEELAIKAGFQILSEGTSEDSAEQQSRRALPLAQLSPQARSRANEVLGNCHQFRSLPGLRYSADPAIYRYLFHHPDVAVASWRVMGISRFQMWQTGANEFEAEASDGSTGIVDVLYRDSNRCLFICEGSYANPLLPKPLEARALIWFTSSFQNDATGVPAVTQNVDVFVSFPSNGVAAVAKVLTPVTNPMMDRNIFEVSLYASMMSRAVSSEPEWVMEVARQLQGVLPQRPNELIEIAKAPRVKINRPLSSKTSDTNERDQLISQTPKIFEPPVIRAEDLSGDTSQSGSASRSASGNSSAKITTGPGPVPDVPQSQTVVQIPVPEPVKARTVSSPRLNDATRKADVKRTPSNSSTSAADVIQIVPGFRAAAKAPLKPVQTESPSTTTGKLQEAKETAKSDGFQLQDVTPPVAP